MSREEFVKALSADEVRKLYEQSYPGFDLSGWTFYPMNQIRFINVEVDMIATKEGLTIYKEQGILLREVWSTGVDKGAKMCTTFEQLRHYMEEKLERVLSSKENSLLEEVALLATRIKENQEAYLTFWRKELQKS